MAEVAIVTVILMRFALSVPTSEASGSFAELLDAELLDDVFFEPILHPKKSAGWIGLRPNPDAFLPRFALDLGLNIARPARRKLNPGGKSKLTRRNG